MAETCPRCGFAEASSDKCPQCGVMVAGYRESLEKMRRGPQRPAAPVSSASTALPVQPAAVQPAARPVAAPPPRLSASAPSSRHAVFRGSGSTLFGIWIVNRLLILATLGVYLFWAKVRERSYLWSQTEFEGDRFAYHGTGRELFIGFLKVLAVFFIPAMLLKVLPELFKAGPVMIVVTRMLLSILGIVIYPIAIVGARRYRLSRTSWRGIRFSLRASTRRFMGIWIRGWLLTSITFGLYYPSWVTNQHRFLTSHTWFGSERFTFDGRGRDLIGAWVVATTLAFPTLGLSLFWFSAKRQRYYAEHTRFAGGRFRSTVTGGGLAWLTISTWVGLIGTLGLAWPWLTLRKMRRTFAWLSLDGPVALDGIRQQAQEATATGEGLAGFFDADLGFT
jgi:uncharacterized membrane protein YjgN (DUF898 family)